MVTDAQVRLMRLKRMDGETQAVAAAASGMSLRTAREWATGPAPSATKQPRDWRTRPDPFAAVWLTEGEPIVLRSYWVLVVMDQFTRCLVGVSVHCGPVNGADLCRMFN